MTRSPTRLGEPAVVVESTALSEPSDRIPRAVMLPTLPESRISPDWITAVAADGAAVPEPNAFAATTVTRRYFHTSAGATVYDAVVAPAPVAFAQPVEPLAETCHW